ncbi:glutamic acid-rich protein [Biomphalaria glabrata]|nr:glutamic acid-rich protein [Biomphalaria glabrata]
MDGINHGQRLLLALSQETLEKSDAADISMAPIVFTLGGIICLIFLVLLCVCKDGEKKEEDISLQERGQINVTPLLEETEDKVKPANDAVTNWTNGGPKSPNTGHSRQASAGSVNMRPQSLRELPEPPVSNHTRNTSMSGMEMPSSSVKNNGATDGPEYAYPHHVPLFKNNQNNRGSSGMDSSGAASGENKVKSHSEGYDHLGVKSSRPTDYDTFVDPVGAEEVETPVSETGSARDGHFSRFREEIYAVVRDVGSSKKQSSFNNFMSAPSSSGVDHYSLVKDEDPYNSILDSDGTVSPAASRLVSKQNANDLDDPYSTCQDSGGGFKSLMEEIGAVGGLSMQQQPLPDYGDSNDEYAMVDKSGRVHKEERDKQFLLTRNEPDEEDIRPPEPPRLYNEEVDTFQVITSSGHRKEHKYSKVTARESLASMTERNALNPYEIVSDLPENMYATVEGGSGDGVVLRNNTAASHPEQRLSQLSDTYAEIGISGGGLSTSVISNSSSVGGNNNSVSSGAPVPPSLDSLHLMTKSQTSSEGDRLSDRHLATPEDTGLNLLDDDDTGEDTEDGYSTLRRSDGFSPRNSALQSNPLSLLAKEGSEETSLNFQRVRNDIDRETDNDPNYESVDETRAKVAALRAQESNAAGSKTTEFKLGSLGNNTASNNVAKMPRRRMDHDYEEVDITPPSSPLTSQRIIVTSSYMSSHISSSSSVTTSSRTSTSVSSSHQEDNPAMYESHMYEELSEVRAKKTDMNKPKKAPGHGKSNQEDKKKGGVADKKKSASGEKRKGEAEEKKKEKNEEKRKSGSDEKKKEEKKKSEEKKKHNLEEKHNHAAGHSNGTRL